MAKSDDLINATELYKNLGIDLTTPPQMQSMSAAQFSRQQNEYEQAVRQAQARVERNDAAIQRTAQESIEHTRLLEKQLQEVQAQNEMLQTQNEMLKDEFAANRKDIEANAKANKHTRIFSIVTTVISIAIALAGLIIAIA